MYSSSDHNALKHILLYQSVTSYLSDREKVQKMTEDELNEFKSFIVECFEVCSNYNGHIDDIIEGCKQIIDSKEYIETAFPGILS